MLSLRPLLARACVDRPPPSRPLQSNILVTPSWNCGMSQQCGGPVDIPGMNIPHSAVTVRARPRPAELVPFAICAGWRAPNSAVLGSAWLEPCCHACACIRVLRSAGSPDHHHLVHHPVPDGHVEDAPAVTKCPFFPTGARWSKPQQPCTFPCFPQRLGRFFPLAPSCLHLSNPNQP